MMRVKLLLLSFQRCRHLFSTMTNFRVTTCMENLEMSGNLLKVREVSIEKSRQGKVAQNLFIVS